MAWLPALSQLLRKVPCELSGRTVTLDVRTEGTREMSASKDGSGTGQSLLPVTPLSEDFLEELWLTRPPLFCYGTIGFYIFLSKFIDPNTDLVLMYEVITLCSVALCFHDTSRPGGRGDGEKLVGLETWLAALSLQVRRTL